MTLLIVSDEYSIQICYNCTIASIHDRPQAAENNNGLEPHHGDAKLERTNEFQKQQSKKTEHTKLKARLFLNVVVRKCSSVLQLLSSEYETLLVRRNAFLVLDLGLDIVDCVRRLHFKGAGDCLTGQGLDKNLHATTKAKDEVERRLLLDVVIRESSTIFKLLSGED